MRVVTKRQKNLLEKLHTACGAKYLLRIQKFGVSLERVFFLFITTNMWPIGTTFELMGLNLQRNVSAGCQEIEVSTCAVSRSTEGK